MKKAVYILTLAATMFCYTAKSVADPAPSYTKRVRIEIADDKVHEIRL